MTDLDAASPDQSGESERLRVSYAPIGRYTKIIAFLLVWVAVYVGSFYALRRHFSTTDLHRAPDGSMRFVSTIWFFFSENEVLNRLGYWVYYPIHRYGLSGQTVEEFDADVISRPNAMRRRNVYVEDIEAQMLP